MFKRIRRYLLFLCVFTFATTNIADLGICIDEEALEAASVELPLSKEDTLEDDRSGPLAVQQKEQKPEEQKYLYEICSSEQEENLWDTSLSTVSDYIHTYQKLPPVYITKKEAYELGWLGGNLSEISSTKSIGGDYFGNYQGILPQKDGRSYWECDIDTLGRDSRGKKRLVFSNDGLMYYTEDHYESFTLLYSEWDSYSLQGSVNSNWN